MNTVDNFNGSGAHIKQHAIIEHDSESSREREVNEMLDFIASFCADANNKDIIRRAAMNLYNVGRTHEAMDSVARMMETTRMIVESAQG